MASASTMPRARICRVRILAGVPAPATVVRVPAKRCGTTRRGRLGGYRRESFITQTSHFAAMADAIIDLDAMQVDARAGGDTALVAEVAGA